MAARENLPKVIGNNIDTTLVSSMTNVALSLQVNDATGIGTTGGYIVVDYGVDGKEEVMYCESRSSNTLTIATDGRGLAGTSAVAHDAGAQVNDVLIDEHINNLRAAFIAEHDQAGAHTAINSALSLSGNTINSSNKVVDANASNMTSGIAPSGSNKIADATTIAALNVGILRQAIINGGCKVAQRVTAPTISSSYKYGAVDRFAAKGGGTAVSAGTIAQTTSPNAGSSGHALKLAGVTLTGTGITYVRYRMESRDAVNFKNGAASFSVSVYHDVGSSVNYTIYIRKANAQDGFSAVTDIANSGAISVPNTTKTTISFENINSGNLGDVTNGIEIEIQAACGAITTKNFEYSEFQFNKGATALSFQGKKFVEEYVACQRYYQKSYALSEGVPTNNATNYERQAYPTSTFGTIGNNAEIARVRFFPRMLKAPSVTIYSYAESSTSVVSDNNGTAKAAGSGTPAVITEQGFVVTNSSGGNITCSLNLVLFGWKADAEL